MSNEDLTTARLLSGRDEPSVLEQEAMFERVIGKIARTRKWYQRRSTWTTLSVAAAAAAVLAMRQAVDREPQWSARGTTTDGSFALTCAQVPEQEPACHAGAKVHLEVEPPAGRPFFGLVARRPDGAMVWFYPKRQQATRSIAGQTLSEAWSEALLLPEDAPRGTYQWYALFSARPMTREQLKHVLGDALRSGPDLTVVERQLRLTDLP